MIIFIGIVLALAGASSELSKAYPEKMEKSERQVCAESKYACLNESMGGAE